jgi:hypothetical protein
MENTIESTARIAVEKALGMPGRMIAGSKSGYRNAYPGNAPVFNSNIVVERQKVWYGDIDLTISGPLLVRLAAEIGSDVHVLPEFAARFDNENKPQMSETIALFCADGTVKLGKAWGDYLQIVDNVIKTNPI